MSSAIPLPVLDCVDFSGEADTVSGALDLDSDGCVSEVSADTVGRGFDCTELAIVCRVSSCFKPERMAHNLHPRWVVGPPNHGHGRPRVIALRAPRNLGPGSSLPATTPMLL